MADYDITAGLKEIGSDLADKIVIGFTPDVAIDAIDDLVHMAVSKDMTGAEKAEWVLKETLEMGGDLVEWFLPRLIELLYKIMMGYIEDFRNGNN